MDYSLKRAGCESQGLQQDFPPDLISECKERRDEAHKQNPTEGRHALLKTPFFARILDQAQEKCHSARDCGMLP